MAAVAADPSATAISAGAQLTGLLFAAFCLMVTLRETGRIEGLGNKGLARYERACKVFAWLSLVSCVQVLSSITLSALEITSPKAHYGPLALLIVAIMASTVWTFRAVRFE